MAISRLAFAIAFCALVCNNFSLVRTADTCKTNADCKSSSPWWPVCCGGRFGSRERSCSFGSCLHKYCSVDSDCGDSSMCCRSNRCVKDGCSGCTNDTDCSLSHVCCKKTFSLDQTVCGSDCINESCNWNDDCSGWSECCRSGKCVDTGCNEKCTSNSECNLGQYCCKKKSSWLYWGNGCSVNCSGEICSSDDDCGGPQECCISNKCVTSGCSGCTTNSNCSTGHYCCKKRHWYELNECSADCIGKSCGANNDCGGPDGFCDSNNRCANIKPTQAIINISSSSSSYLPPWTIAVIVVSIVVLLVAVGVFVAVFWYFKRLRPANATRANRGTVPLQNTQYQTAAIPDPQPSTQFSSWNNPAQYQGTGFQNHPQPTANVAGQRNNLPYHLQGLSNGVQGTPHQGVMNQNPPEYTPYQGNENPGFCDLSQDHYHQPPMTSNHNQHTKVGPLINPPHDPVYHTLETSDTAQESQYEDNTGQQIYPQNTPNQRQSNDNFYYPPYNPQYAGNH